MCCNRPRRRTRDSNPQPREGQLISNQPACQFAYPPRCVILAKCNRIKHCKFTQNFSRFIAPGRVVRPTQPSGRSFLGFARTRPFIVLDSFPKLVTKPLSIVHSFGISLSLADKVQQQRISRRGHAPVIKPFEFLQGGPSVSGNLHHSPQVGVFLIPT